MKSSKRGRSINQVEETSLFLSLCLSLYFFTNGQIHARTQPLLWSRALHLRKALAWVLLPTNSSSITLSSSARASLKTVTKALAPVRLRCASMSQVSTICCTSTLIPLSSTSTPSTLNPQPKTPVCTSDPPSHPPFLRLNHHPLSRNP